jgi:dephospho-CoA kinase
MEQAAHRPDLPLVIGLTGGIGAGKTSVSQQLREWDAHVIDADSVGHRVIAPDGEAYKEVVAAFGEEILENDGTIDRRRLGAIVFGDPDRLKALNAISHPRMAERMAREIAELKARHQEALPPLIVLDAAILFEAGWDAMCDETWAVVARAEVAVERLMARDGLGREEADARLNAQMSNEERTARADRVIHNESSLEELRDKVEGLWREATAGRAASSPARPHAPA